MKVFLECISAPTADTDGASFILQFDSKRYLFGNIHEGFQRAALEQGAKLIKISDVFLTGKNEWRSTGGLIGFVLTLADAIQSSQEALKDTIKKLREKRANSDGASGVVRKPLQDPKPPRVAIHGGANLAHLFATCRRFIFRQGLPIDVHEHHRSATSALDPTWEDELIRVWALPVTPGEHSPTNRLSKRSFDEFLEAEDQLLPEPPEDMAATDSKEQESSTLLKSIVRDMFESDWRLDSLYEINLRELELPAAVFVRNTDTKRIEKYPEKVPNDPEARPDITVLVRKPWPGAQITSLPSARPSPVSMSYIVRTHPQRGKFLREKANELKVAPLDNFRRLAEGQTVTLEDGRIVTPEQVLGPTRPGVGFLMAEVPSTEYLEGLLSRPEFSDGVAMQDIKAMVWILGKGVVEDPRFQSFIQQHPKAEQIIASGEYNANNLVFGSAGAATIRHAVIDPERYDFPSFNDQRKELPDTVSGLLAERGLMVQLEPQFKLDTKQIPPPLNTKAVSGALSKTVIRAADEAKEQIRSDDFLRMEAEQQLPGGDNEIITLGTGSALPSKYRNVSATLLRVPGKGSYLFDCGENTLGQLSRVYTPDQLRSLLCDLKMIWISHLHADHHLGITSVIKAWYKASQPAHEAHMSERSANALGPLLDPAECLKKPNQLFIASDVAMIQWLREYSQLENIGEERLVMLETSPAEGSSSLRWLGQEVGFGSENPEIIEALQSATGLSNLSSCYVPHCKGAQGVAFTFPDGFKITYSGDTRPSRSLVAIGQNSTVLIHEATFDDERAGDAQAKNHSTTSQAINVGRRMNAKRVLLTHFSQRYTKIPIMSDIVAQDVSLVDLDDVDLDAAEHEGAEGDSALLFRDGNAARPPGSRPGSARSTSRPSSRTRGIPNDMSVAVAFDSMHLKVKDFMALEKFTPALLALYEDANPATLTEEQKAEKYEKHLESKRTRKAEQRAKKEQQQQDSSRPVSAQGEVPGTEVNQLLGTEGTQAPGTEGAIAPATSVTSDTATTEQTGLQAASSHG